MNKTNGMKGFSNRGTHTETKETVECQVTSGRNCNPVPSLTGVVESALRELVAYSPKTRKFLDMDIITSLKAKEVGQLQVWEFSDDDANFRLVV